MGLIVFFLIIFILGMAIIGYIIKRNVGKNANQMTPCKTCGSMIARKAVRCPHCGARNGNNIGAGSVAVAIILILLGISLIIAVNSEVVFRVELVPTR